MWLVRWSFGRIEYRTAATIAGMHWNDVKCRRLISCINPAFTWKSLSQEGQPPSLKPVLPKYDTGLPTVRLRRSVN